MHAVQPRAHESFRTGTTAPPNLANQIYTKIQTFIHNTTRKQCPHHLLTETLRAASNTQLLRNDNPHNGEKLNTNVDHFAGETEAFERERGVLSGNNQKQGEY